MSDIEQELFRIIRENDNPAEALLTAAAVILGFLKRDESSVGQVPAYLQAHA